MKRVFLSGPMRGVDRVESLAWRTRATELLEGSFSVIHAFRGREEKETFNDPRAAVARDLSDIKDSDILLVNDTVETASMIGTAMEVFHAYRSDMPVIVFGYAHEKDYWLNYHSHLRVNTLEEACDILKKMFM
jgi:phosphoribosylpyrophosphate synthetase